MLEPVKIRVAIDNIALWQYSRYYTFTNIMNSKKKKKVDDHC